MTHILCKGRTLFDLATASFRPVFEVQCRLDRGPPAGGGAACEESLARMATPPPFFGGGHERGKKQKIKYVRFGFATAPKALSEKKETAWVKQVIWTTPTTVLTNSLTNYSSVASPGPGPKVSKVCKTPCVTADSNGCNGQSSVSS